MLNLIFFNISFSFCVRNGYETISFGDDFMGCQRQIVHSIPDAPLCGALYCYKGLFLSKKVIEEVSR